MRFKFTICLKFQLAKTSALQIAMIDERMKDYENDPSSFAPLKH
jgi:hypothetical protein